MVTKTNMEQALDSIKRIGSFSEGEKIALIKGLRLALFPGNWVISSPSDNDYLQYDSTSGAWGNVAAPTYELDDLTDVSLTSLTTDEVLKWNGSAWTNSAEAVTSVNTYTGAVVIDMEDVTPTSIKGDLLVDNGSAVTYLSAGTDGHVLTADSSEATGIKWSAVAGVEGVDVLSTGEAGGTKFLREDGDGTCSWQSIPGGGDALTANPLSQFAATTSAQLAGVMSDETGSGALVFATSPTLVTPALGTPSAGSLGSCTDYLGTAIDSTGGTSNQVLTSDGGGNATWETPSSGFADPMTTRGDIIIRDSSNTTARLGIGANTYVLTSDGTDISWAAPTGGGSSTFISLTDTPSSYSGSANKALVVNGTGDAIIFADAPVTQVTGTAPIVSSGGTTPDISIVAATTSVNGYMSSTDKTKLDSVDSNADETRIALDALSVASGISTSDEFLIVDASDNLGKQVTWTTFEAFLDNYFAEINHTHTGTTISDLAASDTTSGTFDIARIPTGTSGTTVALGNHGHSDLGALDSTPTFSGECTAASFNATSQRAKKNILGSGDAIMADDLEKLHPVIYSLKDDDSGRQHFGYIAEEVARVYPEVCSFDENGAPTGIDYSRLVVPLIMKVMELEARLDDYGA